MLVFTLKKHWFEKIKSGEKSVEYREVKPYWTKRLNPKSGLGSIFLKLLEAKGGEFCNIPCKLRLGYTNKYMTASVVKIEIVDGNNTDLHINKPVYAFYLKNIKEVEQ